MQACVSFVGAARAPLRSARSRSSVRVSASADRPLWLPGAKPPAHLNGSLPGDSGFDPLGLGVDPERLKWYAEAEKTNGRWAMAAVAGILFTDAMGLPRWFDEAQQATYWADPKVLTAIMFPIIGFFELKRYQGWKETGTSGFLNSFPYDPLNQNSPTRAVNEVKNGRLAMVAFIGFCVQALVTREGPLENLTSHLGSPFTNNIVGSIANLPNVIGK